MQIVYLTAGAAGMYCGSCLHDNALAKSLIQLGHDAVLIPTYTPILTDEENISSDRLFYGGLNVYLEQVVPGFRWLPNWADQFLSSPRLVGWIASRAMGTSAKNLGALTVSMLKGVRGNQRKEVRRLCDWLSSEVPDVVIFSNLLIAGSLSEIKSTVRCPVVVVLQGDDIFYDSLIEPFRQQALTELRRLSSEVDLFIVHSQDYGARMQQLLGFPRDRLGVVPLSIDTSDYAKLILAAPATGRPPAVGYLARLAPEKGLHILVDAFIRLNEQDRVSNSRLEIAGWLGLQHASYWEKQKRKLEQAGLSHRFRYHGSVDRTGKLQFLQSIDVLSVPTTYQEPKGLFVLEAVAAGVPYIQPAHGAFPELHQRLDAGYLFDPNQPDQLVERLANVLSDPAEAKSKAQLARQALCDSASTPQEAAELVRLIQQLIPLPL